MPPTDPVADRLRVLLASTPAVEEKRMFGSLAFMVNDKMCICAGRGRILCRLSPDEATQVMNEPGVEPMIMKGKTMRGYVTVPYEELRTKAKLQKWLNRCLSFNAVLTGVD